MSRRGRRGRNKSDSATRDAVTSTPLADRLFMGSLRPQAPFSTAAHVVLTELEDRRTYHPLGFFRPARTTEGVPSGPLKVKSKPFRRSLPFGLQFGVPDKTIVCVRRKRRKEVLHALRKTGGGAGRRKPKRNWLSSVSC